MKRIRRGSQLGKYRLTKRLGEGASAEVWLGQDTVQRRKVAVKIILPSVVESFGREATEQEARVAARLDHPNIVAIRNADWIDGFFVIVTDPAVRSLEGYGGAKRSSRLALTILHDVARGLAYAHSRRVIHRDLKPGNILLYAGNHARLGDFGTARFAPAASLLQTEVGTQAYMAPEQAYGRPRYASDVFSLGLVGYELLAGTLPTWPFAWPPDRHDRFSARVPERVQKVIRKAIEVDPERRWSHGMAFLEAFENALPKDDWTATRGKRNSKSDPKRVRKGRKESSSVSPFEHEARWFKRQFGRALQLDYSCHSCDGPIAESMQACPWCGTNRNSFIEVSRYPLVCPECERGVRPEWDACPWCFAGRFESNQRQPPRDTQAERGCRNRSCDGQLRRFMRYCPRCKTKISRPWRVEGLKSCSRCRWPTSERWRFCAWCSKRQRGSLLI